MPAPRTLIIVGAGFCGAMTAVHLLRHPPAGPVRIVLVERAAEPARGVAYARHDYPYPLNVPVARMAATTADPGEFLRYATGHDPAIRAHDFVARELYGQYLQDLLTAAIAERPAQVEVERRCDSVSQDG